jgi:uncharacterized protein (TIGR02217 family)
MNGNIFLNMNYLDILFPTNIGSQSIGGPQFITNIQTAKNGNEVRLNYCTYPRIKYDISYGIKTKEDMDHIISFFRICQGKLHAFRFKDLSDYKIENQIIGIADGETKSFKAFKEYKIGEYIMKRNIAKLIPDKTIIYIDDEIQDKSLYSISEGEIIFTSFPKKDSIVKITSEFEIIMRFDNDNITTNLNQYGVYNIQNISLIEII